MKLLFLLLCSAALTLAADFSGKWQFEVKLADGNTGRPVFTLKQAGNKLDGTYNGPLGELKATGEVKGDTFTITVNGERDGNPVKLVYTGKAAGAGKISGEMSFNGQSGSTFEGTKAK